MPDNVEGMTAVGLEHPMEPDGPLPSIEKLEVEIPNQASEPLSRDEAAWKVTKAAFQSLYGPYFPSQDSTENFAAQRPELPVIKRPDNIPHPGQFFFNQFDVLIYEVRSLLEESLNDYLKYKDLSAKASALGLEISAFMSNDEIHEDEIKKGVYVAALSVSIAEYNSQSAKSEGFSRANVFPQKILDNYLTKEKIEQSSHNSQLLAWLPYLKTFEVEGVGAAIKQTWNGVAETSANHSVSAAGELSYRDLYTQLWMLQGQIDGQYNSKRSIDYLMAGTKAKLDWDIADVDFKRRRTQVARNIADQKVQLSVQQGGSLNFPEQADTVKRRSVRKLFEAIVRMDACVAGLNSIGGIFAMKPPSCFALLEQGEAYEIYWKNIYDDAYEWTHTFINRLHLHVADDQEYTATLSLRKLVGEDNWKLGAQTGVWEFNLWELVFPKQFCIRLRGLNAFVRGSEGIWKAAVSIPSSGDFKQANGAWRGAQSQKHIRPLQLGKITRRNESGYQEVFGVRSLRNASPLGEWSFILHGASTVNESFDLIQDIELDLDLAVKSEANG